MAVSRTMTTCYNLRKLRTSDPERNGKSTNFYNVQTKFRRPEVFVRHNVRLPKIFKSPNSEIKSMSGTKNKRQPAFRIAVQRCEITKGRQDYRNGRIRWSQLFGEIEGCGVECPGSPNKTEDHKNLWRRRYGITAENA